MSGALSSCPLLGACSIASRSRLAIASPAPQLSSHRLRGWPDLCDTRRQTLLDELTPRPLTSRSKVVVSPPPHGLRMMLHLHSPRSIAASILESAASSRPVYGIFWRHTSCHIQRTGFRCASYSTAAMEVPLTAPNGKKWNQPVGLFINNEFVASSNGQKLTSINPT